MTPPVRCTFQAAKTFVSDMGEASQYQIDELSIGTIREISKILDFIDRGDPTKRIIISPINDKLIKIKPRSDGQTLEVSIRPVTEVEHGFFTSFFKKLAEFVGYIPSSETLKNRIMECKNSSISNLRDDL